MSDEDMAQMQEVHVEIVIFWSKDVEEEGLAKSAHGRFPSFFSLFFFGNNILAEKPVFRLGCGLRIHT
jgi:hypothetical protein